MNKCCNFLNGREVRGYVQQTSHNLLKTTEKVIFNKPFDEELTTMGQKMLQMALQSSQVDYIPLYSACDLLVQRDETKNRPTIV